MIDKDVQYLRTEEIQHELLNLLRTFDSFCNAHELNYCIAAGTLLGAVRHKGFIPWDTDIDVHMPRPDFQKLIELCHQLPDKTDLITYRNSSFGYPFAKFRSLDIRAQEQSTIDCYEGYLWIDIFPIDGVSDTDKSFSQLRKRISSLKRRITFLSVNIQRTYSKSIFKRLVAEIYAAVPSKSARRAKLITRFDRLIAGCNYGSSSRVASLCSDSTPSWTLDRTEYENKTFLKFEGYEFPVMGCWDKYLRLCYGEYMTIPPKEKRVDHHQMKVWKLETEAHC